MKLRERAYAAFLGALSGLLVHKPIPEREVVSNGTDLRVAG